MANKYAVVSGLWSDTAVWSDSDGGAGGATVPADGDAVFISAAIEVIMDVDQSAFTGLFTVTVRGGVTPGELIWKDGAGPALRIGTTNTNVRTDRFSYLIASTFYASAAIPAGTALSGSDVPEDLYGAWALDIGTNGTIDITEATGNATGYASAILAIAGLPAVAASHVRIGTVTAMKSDGVFDPGTTALDAANTTVAYADIAGATFSYGYLKIRTTYDLVGTTSTNRGRILVNSDGVWGNTGSLAFINKAIIDLQGTSTITATNLDIQVFCTQPTNLFVRTYGTKYDFTASAITVDVVNNTIDLGTTPPAADTAVMITSATGVLPTGLYEDTLYYIRAVSGNTCKLSLYINDAEIVDLTGTGSGTCTIFTGHTSTSTDTLNVLDDVTGDAAWVTIDGHDRVALVNARPNDADYQRLQLTAINAGTIQLSANVDSAQYPAARIVLSSRNVSIRSNGTSASQSIVTYAAGTTFTGSVFQCEIVNTASVTATSYGVGAYRATGHTFSGTLANLNYGLQLATSCITSGVVTACTAAHYGCISGTISGQVIGAGYADQAGINSTFSGSARGCSTAIRDALTATISGSIKGCSAAMGGQDIRATSTALVSFCTSIFSSAVRATFAGTGRGGANACYQSSDVTFTETAVLVGLQYTFRFYSNDVRIISNPNISVSPLILGRNALSVGALYYEDAGGELGAHKILHTNGDIIKTACDGTGDAPSVDPDGGNGNCIEVSNVQSNIAIYGGLRIFEHRIWATASVSKTYTYKMQTTYAGLETAGRLVLTGEYYNSGVAVTHATETDNTGPATRSNDTDWTKTMAVTINPSQTGWVTLKLVLNYYESGNELYVWPDPDIT